MFDIFYIGEKPNLFPYEQAVSSIEQAQQLSRTRYCWVINYLLDCSEFDFIWEPVPWESHQRHAWASQWQKDSGLYLIPKDWSGTDTNYHTTRITRTPGVPIVEIDHLDNNAGKIQNTIKTVRFFDNYRDTLIRIAKSLKGKHEYVWICSSVCDYSNFDFSWHPDVWQSTMLHVFPSNEQQFGDTFYMHVPTFADNAEHRALLEWYDLNYTDIAVPRRQIPVIQHNYDSQVDAVKTINWDGPLALFTTHDYTEHIPAVPLWRSEVKTIIPLNSGATAVVVPKNSVPYIKTQLYDYPYIDKTQKTCSDELQDVVFISYDEPDADLNWKILKERCPRAVRVHGVAGMELALEAAANVSNTPWYYAVFAKTRLHEGFDFSFVPDRMQQPKHYIFDCRNSSNGLEYGHMGMILYNCAGIRETNATKNFGLDYTLSFPHESIPLLSCYGDFATTPYHAWRTSFRETAKLAYFEIVNPSVDNSYRLNTWLTKASGNNAEWVLKGANDGFEFFKTTDGDLEKLKQSFRWEWLRNYFESRYGDLK